MIAFTPRQVPPLPDPDTPTVLVTAAELRQTADDARREAIAAAGEVEDVDWLDKLFEETGGES